VSKGSNTALKHCEFGVGGLLILCGLPYLSNKINDIKKRLFCIEVTVKCDWLALHRQENGEGFIEEAQKLLRHHRAGSLKRNSFEI
jgi:hypothetical protein